MMQKCFVLLAVVFVAGSMARREENPRRGFSEASPLLAVLSPERSDQRLARQKRFTCDLLSFGVDGVSGFNHAACAAKCLAQRHWGGHCDGANCKCVEKKW